MDESDAVGRRQVPAWFARSSRYAWGFLGIVAATGAVVVGLGYLRELVVPLVLAAFFAVVFEPALGWLEARRIPRGVGAAIVIAGLGIVIAGSTAIVVLGVIDQTDEISERLTEAQIEVQQAIDQSDVGDYVERIRDSAGDAAPAARDGIGAKVGTFLDSAAGFASGMVLGVVLLYYLLKDGAGLVSSYVSRQRPRDREQALRIFAQAASSIRGYFRGKTVLALAQGVFISIALAIMDVPLAGSVGVVNFIGAYIPFLGAFIGGAFAVLMAISEGGIGLALGALAVVLFTNVVLENVLEPRFLGASLKLHPIVVLLSTVAGGVVAGIAGLILAAPLTSIGINLFHELKASGFFGSDSFDTARPEPEPPVHDTKEK
ncbi:AI-2E family transporter [Ilumatobacter sp.]|uniref:AI-2E family transporter n=1 Tax=Ilumatobacter sp. TaxID=1967498 RepID=UPI003AF5872D